MLMMKVKMKVKMEMEVTKLDKAQPSRLWKLRPIVQPRPKRRRSYFQTTAHLDVHEYINAPNISRYLILAHVNTQYEALSQQYRPSS
jgi:hypothetical protein